MRLVPPSAAIPTPHSSRAATAVDRRSDGASASAGAPATRTAVAAPSSHTSRLAFVGVSVLAAATVVAAYANHFDNGFHFDDGHCILDNLAIRSLYRPWRFFTDAATFSVRPQNATYRPLLSLSYAMDHWAAGRLDPRQFHRTQFALLLALWGLLAVFYARLCALGRPAAWNRYAGLFGATWFCVHTANTETINYISSRSDLLATLGVVTAFVVYLFSPPSRALHLYLVPVMLGGLAKPLAVVFGPLLCGYVFLLAEQGALATLQRSAGRRTLGRAVGRSAPALVASALLFGVLMEMDADSVQYALVNRWDYLRTQLFVWVHYVRLFFIPAGLTADTDWALVPAWHDTRVFAGGVFLAGLGVVLERLSRSRKRRPVAFGLLWFAVALVPTSTLFPLSEVYNEHRLFLPYVGLTFAVTYCGALALEPRTATIRARPRAVIAAVLALVILGAHAVGTYRRNRVWKDDETLWADVVRKSPQNGRALMNYGLALMQRGRLREALAYYERARIFTPNYTHLEVNLAIVKSALGDDAAAEGHFRRALELEPRFARGRLFFARWLLRQGRGPEALAHLQTSIKIAPGDVDARVLLLGLQAAVGDAAALESLARATLDIAPTDETARAYLRGGVPFQVAEETAVAYETLGRSKIMQEEWLDAAVVYRRALSLDRSSAVSWNNLGWALARLGFHAAALPCFAEAMALDPTMAVAAGNHAWAQKLAAAGQTPIP
jgi:tetratricopeptide (TPR) repeat protein